MSRPVITRGRTVLDRDPTWHSPAGRVRFFTEELEDSPVLHLSNERWESLGRPDQLTITVEPGDLLNGGTEDKTVTAAEDEGRPAEGAVIEFVERVPSDDGQGIGCPNVVLINGTPVAIPVDGGIQIENLDAQPSKLATGGTIVRVRMFAKRIVIGQR